MQPAVATRELVNNGAKIVGPIISGAIVSFIGIKWAFYLDSLTFILSALFLSWVPGAGTVRTNQGKTYTFKRQSFMQQFKEGFRFIIQSPRLLAGLLVFCFVFFALQIADSQIVILLRELDGDPTNLLGWIMAASGTGVICASLLLNKKEIKSYLTSLCFGSMELGSVLALEGTLIHSPYLLVAILYPLTGIIAGFSFGMAMMPFDIMVQKMTPQHLTGRVFGVIGSFVTTSTLLGLACGGLISQYLGVVFTFILSGSLLVMCGMIVYSFRRRLDGVKKDAESITGTLH